MLRFARVVEVPDRWHNSRPSACSKTFCLPFQSCSGDIGTRLVRMPIAAKRRMRVLSSELLVNWNCWQGTTRAFGTRKHTRVYREIVFLASEVFLGNRSVHLSLIPRLRWPNIYCDTRGDCLSWKKRREVGTTLVRLGVATWFISVCLHRREPLLSFIIVSSRTRNSRPP